MFLRIDRLPVELPKSTKIDPESAAAVQELMGGRFGEMSTLMNYTMQSFNFRGRDKLRPFYDLIASIVRFNTRWSRFVDELGLDHVNRLIDQYNRYYLLEKECCLGSSRLAARFFTPQAPFTRDSLLEEFPRLPVPTLRS